MRCLRIAFAMINCNRRDGGSRAVNEVAERLAKEHEVYLFARKVEDLDLSRIRWRKMPGIPWPEVADFVTYHWLGNFGSGPAPLISFIPMALMPGRRTSSRFKTSSLPNAFFSNSRRFR